ncbi:replicative DNA helicase [Nocardioides sp. R1-1]|uniref:replicative DNA helicase n=1 Tax=Nocardioides sp. R1-1 TaxID=3383502 RepID=UPI0038CFDF3B
MTPPQDEAAERAVLGALLMAGQGMAHMIPEVGDVIRGGDYYRPAHEAIHDAIAALYARKEPVDMVTVAGELQRRGVLDRVGGPMYLHELAHGVPAPGAAVHYARTVLDKALRRRMVDAGHKVIQQALEADDAAQAAEDARQTIDAAASHAASDGGGASVGDSLDEALEWLETPPVGADTPWPDVNRLTNGLLAGQLVTVAGRPGHGKSLVAKDVGLFTAQQGKPAHIATLEMTRNEYMTRILCGMARVDLGKALRRQLEDGEWSRMAEASGRVRDLPLYLDDREGQTMAQIRASARRTQRRYGDLGLIAIDYAGLVRVPGIPPSERRIAMGHVSAAAKSMAKEFYCPVLLLAQLNRGNTQRSDHTPMVTDLKESGDLEQDSDQVWLLHRPDQYGNERLGEVDLIVGKNRNGPAPMTIPLAFQGHYSRIMSLV